MKKKENKAFERVMKWAHTPPKVQVTPTNKIDKKQAKLMAMLIEHEWDKIEPKITARLRRIYRKISIAPVTEIWWDKPKRWWEVWK